ncbi:hypothetical protein BVC80_1289g41 [Macleaya cordata]|uniref:Uncharacterized protein n=1 Tax=Macleaya cordata TaxID=56857 RepID=A0A200Q9L0_MACCD|nr:hypothetical protein BVC80_1289g41 [Macleaya cordata]
MSALSKLRIGLTVVFVLTLLAVLLQLCYVLWHRRLFRRQHLSGAESDITTGTDPTYTITSTPSKELLYFLCWKSQARIEPTFRSATDPQGVPEDSVDEFKLQELYGPSRLLFTIKEEKEEFESDHHQNIKSSSTDDQMNKENTFSTPCGSPPYYTPTPSPSHDEDHDGILTQIDVVN